MSSMTYLNFSLVLEPIIVSNEESDKKNKKEKIRFLN